MLICLIEGWKTAPPLSLSLSLSLSLLGGGGGGGVLWIRHWNILKLGTFTIYTRGVSWGCHRPAIFIIYTRGVSSGRHKLRTFTISQIVSTLILYLTFLHIQDILDSYTTPVIDHILNISDVFKTVF